MSGELNVQANLLSSAFRRVKFKVTLNGHFFIQTTCFQVIAIRMFSRPYDYLLCMDAHFHKTTTDSF